MPTGCSGSTGKDGSPDLVSTRLQPTKGRSRQLIRDELECWVLPRAVMEANGKWEHLLPKYMYLPI